MEGGKKDLIGDGRCRLTAVWRLFLGVEPWRSFVWLKGLLAKPDLTVIIYFVLYLRKTKIRSMNGYQ